MDHLRGIEVFVLIAKSGSFARAAQLTSLSTSSVTEYVRDLEQFCGAPLIERSTHSMRLTRHGQMFLGRAQEILDGVALAEEEVRAASGELHGKLKIEAGLEVSETLLSPNLAKFARRHPRLVMALNVSNGRDEMAADTDVALQLVEPDQDHAGLEPLHTCQYVVCCDPQVALTLPAHPGEIDPEMCLGTSARNGGGSRQWVLHRAGETVNIRPSGALHFNSGSEVLEASRGGLGLAYVPDLFATPLLATGALVAVYPDWKTTSRVLCARTRPDRADSAIPKAFIRFVREILSVDSGPPAGTAMDRAVPVDPAARWAQLLLAN